MSPNAVIRAPLPPLHLVPPPKTAPVWRAPIAEPLSKDPAMKRLIASVEQVAASEIPVLVLGESGVGKEVLVQYLHAKSPRAHAPIVAENCSAIPDALAESLLFGHVRGAFTGANHDSPGLFAQADGGTLFLDEIGDMPAAMQARLLRVLEERRVRPVGGQKSIPVDVRVVCATNRDLAELVSVGSFRADLYYRLAGATLRIPALRERPSDVEPLALRFLDELNSAHGVERRFARGLVDKLRSYAWPGNVRELKNRVAALFLFSTGDEIDGEVSPPCSTRSGTDSKQNASSDANAALVTRVAPLAEIERAAIRLALASTGGDRNAAARLLCISRSTIYARLREPEL